MNPAPTCFSCGNDLVNNSKNNWDKFYELFDLELEKRKHEGFDTSDDGVVLMVKDFILDMLGYNRMCCRRMFRGDCRQLRANLHLYTRGEYKND